MNNLPPFLLFGPNGPIPISYEIMAAASAAAVMACGPSYIPAPPPAHPPQYSAPEPSPSSVSNQYAHDFLRSLKRPRSEDIHDESPATEIRFLKEFTMNMDNEGYERMLFFMEGDMDIVQALVRKNDIELARWVRSQSVDEVYKIIKNIRVDIENMIKENFKYCKYNNACKFKECCSGMHDNQMKVIDSSFRHVQYAANKLIERNTSYHASSLMRSLSSLEVNLWSVLSRRKFGKDSQHNH